MQQKNKRMSRHEYYTKFALLTAQRSTCEVKVGAIAIKDRRVIMAGYNGGLPGEEHCIDVGCLIKDDHCVRTIHAEQNLIIHAAKHGISLEGATVYCTHKPCERCDKFLKAVGVKEVHWETEITR